MARHYKRKRPVSRRGRMAWAARLRAEGMPLRQIAAELGVSHQTIANDPAHLAAEAQVSKLPVKKAPPGGEFLTAEVDSGGVIVPLRRTS